MENIELQNDSVGEYLRVVFAWTCNWIQFGVTGFTVACIVIGAVEGLLTS